MRSDVIEADPEKKRKIKLILFYRKKLIDLIQSMDWKKFEKFCAHLLKLYGANYVGVTRNVKEEGIDFYGIIKHDAFYYIPLFRRVIINPRICIIGQAKRWKNKIDEGHIKKFITEFSNFIREPNSYKTFMPKIIMDCNQIYPLFISSSSFTSGAEKLAEKNKIYVREGSQIVEDLVMLSTIDEISNWYSWSEEKVYINKFLNWLEDITSKIDT